MADICAQCGTRPATDLWVEGPLGLAHGWTSRWCRRCVVTAQLAHARTLADVIPVLEAELRKLETEP